MIHSNFERFSQYNNFWSRGQCHIQGQNACVWPCFCVPHLSNNSCLWRWQRYQWEWQYCHSSFDEECFTWCWGLWKEWEAWHRHEARRGEKTTATLLPGNLVSRVSLLCLHCRWEKTTTMEAEKRDPGNEVGCQGLLLLLRKQERLWEWGWNQD